MKSGGEMEEGGAVTGKESRQLVHLAELVSQNLLWRTKQQHADVLTGRDVVGFFPLSKSHISLFSKQQFDTQ